MLVKSSIFSLTELRAKCSSHLSAFSKKDIKNLQRRNCTFFRCELNKIVDDLEDAGIEIQNDDLTDAFYSCIFEIEYEALILPNALIAPKTNFSNPVLARLNRYTHNYPYVSMFLYQGNGSFLLQKQSVIRDLSEYFLVLPKDPLAKRRGLYD
jgi:hypothetical protein